MSEMATRLRAAREAAGYGSAAEAARVLGINTSTYRAHENGQNEYGPEEAVHYARKFGTTAAYLLTGTGDRSARIVASFDPDEDSPGDIQKAFTKGHWNPSIPGAMAEIDVKLGGGEGTVGEVALIKMGDERWQGHKVVAEWLLSDTFVRYEAKASTRDTIIMEVIGDSMSPTFHPGDRVLVDLSQNTMTTDTVYAISYDDTEPQIKRLQRVPLSDPAQIHIISDNPVLEKHTVDLARISILGRICGHVARK